MNFENIEIEKERYEALDRSLSAALLALREAGLGLAAVIVVDWGDETASVAGGMTENTEGSRAAIARLAGFGGPHVDQWGEGLAESLKKLEVETEGELKS